MTNRTYSLLAIPVAVICVYVLIRSVLNANSLTLRNDLVQGALVGVGLGFATIVGLARIKARTINGWTTMTDCGRPDSDMFTRAACAWLFPGPVNVPEEAMYWKTRVDGAGHALSGARDYVLRFPPGGLPPNDAFWSLTMADTKERFVANPIDRYCVGDRSGLAQNPDGSVDIYIQRAAPAGHESNWLPAPAGGFVLWLRAYMPGPAVLRGEYAVPPIVDAGSRG